MSGKSGKRRNEGILTSLDEDLHGGGWVVGCVFCSEGWKEIGRERSPMKRRCVSDEGLRVLSVEY